MSSLIEARCSICGAGWDRTHIQCWAPQNAEIERLRAAERNYQAAHDLQNEKIERLRAALKPFVDAFKSHRRVYARRAGESGNFFEKMPDDWPIEHKFLMGTYRRAEQALEQKEDGK